MCYYCGESAGNMKITRESVCSICHNDIRVCLNCKFYEEGAHWDCRENIPEQVIIKDRANFCEYFVYVDRINKKYQDKIKKDLEEARGKFLNLFSDE